MYMLMSFSGSSASRKKQLGNNQISNLIVDWRAQKNDVVFQQPRENIERAFAARRLLDDHRN